ncbi:hypothetical protein IJL65_05215 [bacterium]|nr:hypothetical protein [bacterium]
MKLTTKRNRWFFCRELFLYLIPMILIVGTIDVFRSFMVCPLHPEWSAPCSVNWIIAAIYGFFLIIVIILAIISARMLRKVKKKIEDEFTETVDSYIKEQVDELKKSEPKKIIAKKDKKSEEKKASKKVSSKKTIAKK